MKIGYSTISPNNLTMGDTGNPGAHGPRGNTGPTGPDYIGQCGRGETGQYIVSIKGSTLAETYGQYLITYGNGNKEYVNGSVFVGNTLFGAHGATLGITYGTYNLFVNITVDGNLITGSTANFKFKDIISTTSGISLISDADYIQINSDTAITQPCTFKGNFDILSCITNKDQLLPTISDTVETLGFSSDLYSDNYLYFNRANQGYTFQNALIANTKWVDVPPNSIEGYEVYLDLSQGGLFYINTPNSIHGFTGFSGVSGSTGEIISVTLIIEDDYIYHFPSNIWFRPEEAHLSCGENIIGLQSRDQGASWTANIFGRGFDVDQINCLPARIAGSCVFGVNNTCLDYISYYMCKKISGAFCPMTLCANSTPTGVSFGACCLNGKCKDDTPYAACIKYGGRYWDDIKCSADLCYDPCGITHSSCCVGSAPNFTCYNDHTKTACDHKGGAYSDMSCSLRVDCSNGVGACCVKGPPPTCILSSYWDCNGVGGIFLGWDEVCEEVNCDCMEFPTGVAESQSFTPPPEREENRYVKIYSSNTNYVCINITDTTVNLDSYQFERCIDVDSI